MKADALQATTEQSAGGITRLAVQNFRNYSQFSLDSDAKNIVLTGANGIGKTNLLEAISLMAPGKGLRGARPQDWTKDGQSNWGISTTLEDGQRLGTASPIKPNATKRSITHEGAQLSSQAQLAEFMAVVWLTPQMDGLFLGDSSSRRKFIDRLVYAINPDHAVRLYRYEHALRQRNKLLKDKASPALIRALHPVLVAEGVAIAAARLENTEQLNHAIDQTDTTFPLPHLDWSGQVENWLQEKDALSVEEIYRAQLDSQIDEDRIIGQTRIGVHRSDVLATHRAKKIPAFQCSTGEQKALLLSLVLAHAQWLKHWHKDRPLILLMDDVTAHLDPDRRQEMFDWITSLPVQTWFTGTEDDVFTPLRDQAKFFHLPV
jgi:DNA replication and repair protein RecF